MLQSPFDDPEIVLIIPFKEEVKIRCIQLICSGEDTSLPLEANCFKNAENVSFDIVYDPPTQAIPLNFKVLPNNSQKLLHFAEGTANIKTFSNVQKIVVHLKAEA